MSENKTGRYFKYAIGEIILVVIGILIALQINNWNENNIASVYEGNMLKEIHKTLKEDLILFEHLEERMKKKDKAIDNILFLRNGKKEVTDKQLKDDIWWAHAGILFSYNKGPYEALKSSGLDKIKTDSLRLNLTNFYEVTLPRTESLIKYSEEKYEPLIDIENNKLKELDFFKGYFELGKNNKNEEGYYVRTSYSLDKYRTDTNYNEMLLLQAGYKRDIWSMTRNLVKKTKSFIKSVELELETRFNETNL